MDDIEKKEKRREQLRLAQARYYEKHKEEIKSGNASRIKANKKYRKKLKSLVIPFFLHETEFLDAIKEKAKKCGLSVSAYVKSILKKDLEG